MTYRQSNYDPLAPTTARGKPLRPYNWVQWTGVALCVVGLLLVGAMLLAISGVERFAAFKHQPVFLPLLFGEILIFSRREELPRLDSAEQRAKNRQVLVWTAFITAAALGAALVIAHFQGEL